MKPPPIKFFHLLSLVTVATGLLLIWWGAAVTTEDVGLSVPDWPLCFGRLNPEGWWKVPALLLEHGHRWLGATIGMMVLALYFMAFFRERPRLLEAAGLILCGLGFLSLVHYGELALAAAFGVAGLIWLVMTWVSARWSLLRGATTLALLLVIVQASLGGLRVLKMSDPFGVVHGTLGQVFFCLLVLIALASSSVWRRRDELHTGRFAWSARFSSTLLFAVVFMQLVIGAILRHTQRDHLAASDILTTNGTFLPALSPPDVFVLFVHKYWGFTVAVLILMVAWHAMKWVGSATVAKWVPKMLLVMPIIQVGLGVGVIWTGKSFWVTNFHVINGLGLLALSFLLMVFAWARGDRAWGGAAEQRACEDGVASA